MEINFLLREKSAREIFPRQNEFKYRIILELLRLSIKFVYIYMVKVKLVLLLNLDG